MCRTIFFTAWVRWRKFPYIELDGDGSWRGVAGGDDRVRALLQARAGRDCGVFWGHGGRELAAPAGGNDWHAIWRDTERVAAHRGAATAAEFAAALVVAGGYGSDARRD